MADLDELARLQQERRRLSEMIRQFDDAPVGADSRVREVMEEHKRKLDRRFAEALRRVNGAMTEAAD